MRSVLAKIAESLEGEISVEPEWLSEQVSVLTEDRVEVDPDLWAQVVGFLERREVFQADYQTFTGKVSGYELHPLHLLAYHGNWYVLAHNPAKGRVETFALSRFRHIEGLGNTFERPEGFDPRRHARQAFGITGGEKPMKVRLLLEPSWRSTSPSANGTPPRCSKSTVTGGSSCAWRPPGARNSCAGCSPGCPTCACCPEKPS